MTETNKQPTQEELEAFTKDIQEVYTKHGLVIQPQIQPNLVVVPMEKKEEAK